MTLSVTNTFSTGTAIVAAQMNANFDDIEAYVNGTGGNAGLMPKDGGTFSSNLTVNGDITVDTSTFRVDSANNVVGIGTASPSASYKLDVTGDARVSGTLTAGAFSGAITGDVTGNVTGNVSGSSGSCTGNSATATEATNVTVVRNESANETVHLLFADGYTGTQGIEADSGLYYNPSTGLLQTTSITLAAEGGTLIGNVTGNLTGNVTGDVTGDLTGNVNAGTVTLDSVTLNTIQTGSESFANNNVSVMTSAAIEDKIAADVATYGYKKVTIQASAPSGVEGDIWIDT